MKTVSLLLLGLAVLATTSIYFVQKSNQVAQLADDQSCARFFEFGYTSDDEKGVQNICKNQNVTFTIKYKNNQGEKTKSTFCLAYRQTEFVDMIDDSFEIISYTTKAC